MNLTLFGHDDRYAVEQLQMALFPEGTAGEAVSTLHRGKTWLTASTKITLDGRSATASRRLKAAEETVRLRRQALQQSYYLAAISFSPAFRHGVPWQVFAPPSSPPSTFWKAVPLNPPQSFCRMCTM